MSWYKLSIDEISIQFILSNYFFRKKSTRAQNLIFLSFLLLYRISHLIAHPCFNSASFNLPILHDPSPNFLLLFFLPFIAHCKSQNLNILLSLTFHLFHQPNHFPPSLLPLHPPLRIQKHVFLNSSRIRGQFRILPTWHANVHNRFILLTSFMDLIIATGWKETQKNVEVEEEKGVV